ncbi:hypothetical protein ATANTOWER_032824 [Ataeniobius toweri]|uniref:Uncharacterized protein n=1 Tax=Ataeniobius toweri TaxID=208326 RepID=A0ABU7CEI1_9TELE|nr:hypothetical protein [Ataeniobius toweri]
MKQTLFRLFYSELIFSAQTLPLTCTVPRKSCPVGNKLRSKQTDQFSRPKRYLSFRSWGKIRLNYGCFWMPQEKVELCLSYYSLFMNKCRVLTQQIITKLCWFRLAEVRLKVRSYFGSKDSLKVGLRLACEFKGLQLTCGLASPLAVVDAAGVRERRGNRALGSDIPALTPPLPGQC